MSPTIVVRYSCRLCGLVDIKVHVLARQDENVVAWFKGVLIPTVSADHRARRPLCVTRELTDIKVPVDGVDRIGGAPVQ